MKKYRDLIGEDITIFKKFYHKLESVISLNSNGKFIISHEKVRGLRDASKYILSKRMQEMSEIEDTSDSMIVEEEKNDNS
jgi:hypothetical protein